jgi:hypothetical protein
MKSVIRHPAVQSALAWLLGSYIALVIRTSRWELVGAGPALARVAAGQPLILAFWHERLPLITNLFRLAITQEPAVARISPHVLVSQHRDGRFIGDAVSRFGYTMIYGSSRRGGGPALVEMIRALRAGDPVALTPDGPRGPRRQAAPGVAQLAALSGVVVVPVGGASTRHRILPSWDRMMLPLPFGRAVLVMGAPILVLRDGADAALPAITEALNAACAAADAACGIAPAGGA